MEQNDLCCVVSRPNRKRKVDEEEMVVIGLSLDELNQDLLERVLSWLPTSSLVRLGSVCKRWRSVADSVSFKLACSEVPSRDPWFFMVDPHHNQPTIFDSTERSWKKLNYLPFLRQSSNLDLMPVAAAGSLICFCNDSSEFTVCNPVTGLYRKLPPAAGSQCFQAIAMSMGSSDKNSYKLVVVSGELPNLSYKVYHSTLNRWEEEILLKREQDFNSQESDPNEESESAVYFLSMAGNVIVTNMEKSPSKQYSSVVTHKKGEEIIHFLNSSGRIVACNLTRKCFTEYPRLLPIYLEYSIDIIECRGELLVVVLSEFFESASVRVWQFDENTRTWRQVAAMPPAIAQEYYGKRVDINCVGAGDEIFICLNTGKLFSYVVCDLRKNEWIELPNCFVNGEAVEFMSAFAFEPRIEVAL